MSCQRRELYTTSSTASGKLRRLSNLLNNTGKLLLVPLDDSLISGPIRGLERMEQKVLRILEGGPDAVMLFRGHARHFARDLRNTAIIINLTASTGGAYQRHHTRKSLVSSVEDALQLGADAVAVHVNTTSDHEPEMLKQLGQVSEACDRWGIPCLAIMYPRREKDGKDDNFDELKAEDPDSYAHLVSHAVRVAVDLGADLVKTKYPGSEGGLRRVVESCTPIPLVIAGGPATDSLDTLQLAESCMRAGAAGVSFGRRIFSEEQPAALLHALKLIVHRGASVDEARTELEDYQDGRSG